MSNENVDVKGINILDSFEKIDKTKFKILNYFLKEPTIGFTCVSAIIAVLSFLINIAIYLKESAYLQYWDLNIRYVSLSSPNQLYHVCGAIIHSLSVMIALSIINGAYEAYIPSKKIILALSYSIKQKSKKIEKQKDRINQTLKKNQKEDHKKFNLIKKKIRSIKKDMCLLLFVHLFIACMILWLGNSLFMVLSTGSGDAIWLSLILAIIFTLIIYHISVFMHRKELNKEELKKADFLKREKDRLYMEAAHPIERRWINCLNDRSLKSTFFASLVYVVMMLFMFSFYGHNNAKQEYAFPVLFFENQTYASIYTTDDFVILEKCEIVDTEEGTAVNIFKKEQKIIPMDNLEYVIIEFDLVNTIDNCKHQN